MKNILQILNVTIGGKVSNSDIGNIFAIKDRLFFLFYLVFHLKTELSQLDLNQKLRESKWVTHQYYNTIKILVITQ